MKSVWHMLKCNAVNENGGGYTDENWCFKDFYRYKLKRVDLTRTYMFILFLF